eukprot:gene19775-26465_t
MEKAGIHLDEGKRARMQELMNLNNHYSMAYNQALTDPAKVGSITLESSPSSTVGGFFSGLSDQGSRMLTLDSGSVNNVLVSERNANLRKQVYMAASGSPKCNLQLLDEMIAARKEMASLVGCSSYSEYKAKNASLAQEPEAIVGFLSQLSSQIHGMADDEVKILKQYKVVGCAEASGGGFGGALGIGGGPDDGPLPIIFPWDTEYYMARARSDTFSVHLKVEPAPPAESWAPNVLKATAHHAELGDLGTVYLDLLFSPGPPGKPPHGLRPTAHHAELGDLGTVYLDLLFSPGPPGKPPHGLRPTAHHAELGDLGTVYLDLLFSPGPQGKPPHGLRPTAHHAELGDLGTVYLDLLFRPGKYPSAVTFPIRCGRSLESSSGRVQPDLTSKGGDYQLPIMALLCDFGGSTMEDAYLNYREMRVLLHEGIARVLLHELGHCMHNLLSRTRYQHLWGTSYSTQLQILNLMDPVLQVLFSLVDQAYFGPDPPGPGQTSETWAKVAQQHSSIPYVPNTSPEARLGHLTVYGASYYSYVYARCLSSAIWSQHLAEDPLDKSQVRSSGNTPKLDDKENTYHVFEFLTATGRGVADLLRAD